MPEAVPDGTESEFKPDKLKFEKDGLKFFTGAEKAVTGGVFLCLNA
jgi:hypothetical protein